MASTITISILLTILVQLGLVAFFLVRFPSQARRILNFLTDVTRLTDRSSDRPRRRKSAPSTKPALVAIDRPKPATKPNDQAVTDTVQTLMSLGATRINAQQLADNARQLNPNADAVALLAVCFSKLKAA